MESHPRVGQLRERLREEVGGDVAVDEQGLRRVAHARAVGLGVEGDRHGLVEVGGPVDVDVADPDAGLDDRDGRLAHDGLDEVGTAARDDEIDAAARCHQGSRGVVPALDKVGHRIGRESLRRKGVAQGLDDRLVGLARRGPAAENDGVARLQAEARGVDRDVGARLVDHAD